MFLNLNFVKFVFENYEDSKDFNNLNLDMERGKRTDFVSAYPIPFSQNFE